MFMHSHRICTVLAPHCTVCFQRKMDLTLRLLDQLLPAECDVFGRPRGGHFVYIRLPARLHSTTAARRLRTEHGIAVNNGRE